MEHDCEDRTNCEDRSNEAGEGLGQDWDEGPWYVRMPWIGLGSLRGPAGVTWPMNEDQFALMEARRNLEQVGQILRRMDRNRAEIARLRAETRAILADLAA